MAKIKTPVEGFSGVVVGVSFHKGEAESKDPAAIQYFERHGYGVEHDPETPAPLTQPAKSASKADWAAYATQEGKDVDGLSADDIKALFISTDPATGADGGEGKSEPTE